MGHYLDNAPGTPDIARRCHRQRLGRRQAIRGTLQRHQAVATLPKTGEIRHVGDPRPVSLSELRSFIKKGENATKHPLLRC